MANGDVSITFDGIDLGNCIKQGMGIRGQAKCPHCKQLYSFQMHLSLKKMDHRFIEVEEDGKTVTRRVPDAYHVSIEFSKLKEPIKDIDLLTLEDTKKKEKCEPCSMCTVGCDRI